MLNLEELLVTATTIFIGAVAMMWRGALNKSDKDKIYQELDNKLDKNEFNEFKEQIENHLIKLDRDLRELIHNDFCDLKQDLLTEIKTGFSSR